MEIVGPQHVAAESPAGAKSLVCHLHGAKPDLLNRSDIPAQMMQSRCIGADERDHVMIAAVNAMHECDHVAGAVRQAQSEYVPVEIDGLRNIAREDEDVPQSPRPDYRHPASCRRLRLP